MSSAPSVSSIGVAGVEAVDLVEVDMVELEPIEAGVDLVEDVPARSARAVGPGVHPPERLGGDHHLAARNVQVLERLAEDLLGLAIVIDVGGIDEVDAGVERCLDQRIGLVLRELADAAPDTLAAAAEGHRAEAQFGDDEAGAAEVVVAHAKSPGWRGQRGEAPQMWSRARIGNAPAARRAVSRHFRGSVVSRRERAGSAGGKLPRCGITLKSINNIRIQMYELTLTQTSYSDPVTANIARGDDGEAR